MTAGPLPQPRVTSGCPHASSCTGARRVRHRRMPVPPARYPERSCADPVRRPGAEGEPREGELSSSSGLLDGRERARLTTRTLRPPGDRSNAGECDAVTTGTEGAPDTGSSTTGTASLGRAAEELGTGP